MLLPNFLPVTWRCGDVATPPNPLQLSGADSSLHTEEFNSPLRVNTVTDRSSESRRVGNSTRSPWRLLSESLRSRHIHLKVTAASRLLWFSEQRGEIGGCFRLTEIFTFAADDAVPKPREAHIASVSMFVRGHLSLLITQCRVSPSSVNGHRRHFTRATPSGKCWQRSPYCKVHDRLWKYILVSTL